MIISRVELSFDSAVMLKPSILDDEPYVPNVPDLDKLNMTIIV